MSSSKQAELRRLMKLQREKQKAAPPPPKPAPKSILKKSKRPRSPPPTQKQQVSSLLGTNYGSSSDESSEKEPPQKHVVKKAKTVKVAAAAPKEEIRRVATSNGNEMVMRDSKPKVAESTTTDVSTKQPGKVSEEAWKEFEDLINVDKSVDTVARSASAEPMKLQAAKEKNQPRKVKETSENATGSKQPQHKEEEPSASIDTTEVEQVSYEARLAQLRLKVLAKKKQKATATSKSSGVGYTPDLASFTEAGSDSLGIANVLRQKRKKAQELLKEDVKSYSETL